MDAATYRARVAVREVAAYMEFAERAQAPAGFWERGGRWTVYEPPCEEVTHESVRADLVKVGTLLRVLGLREERALVRI